MLAGTIIMQDGYLEYDKLLKSRNDHSITTDFGYLVALYVTCTLIRSLVVLLCAPVIRWTGYGMQVRVLPTAKFIKYMCILSWGGLRGAVGLVLALIVAKDTHLASAVKDPLYCQRVLAFTGGMVIFTTLINAFSLETVIIWLGLAEPTRTEKHLQASAKKFLRNKHGKCMSAFRNRHQHPDLANVDWREVSRQVGPQALFADRYIHDKDLKFVDEHESPEDDNTSRAGDDSTLNLNHFLGRYLVSLRCSYATQYHQGLISSLVYRRIITALSTAIDHVNDGDGEDLGEGGDEEIELSDHKFEWAWLVEMGFLDLPLWLKVLQVLVESSCLDSVFAREWRQRMVKRWTRTEHARCIEIALAVKKAHADTRTTELSMLAGMPDCVKAILEASDEIREKAENRYADLSCRMPTIACAVRTRQSCQLVLSRIEHEYEVLHKTGQISEADFEKYEEILFHKRLHLTHVLPKVAGIEDGKNLLSYYFSDDDMKLLSHDLQEINQQPQMHIARHQQPADSLYFIAAGMVRIWKDEHLQDLLDKKVGSVRVPPSAEAGENGADEIALSVPGARPAIAFGSVEMGAVVAPEALQHEDSRAKHHRDELGLAHAKSAWTGFEKKEVLLGAGCCFNDIEFLLQDAGFESNNFGNLTTVTDVSCYRLRSVSKCIVSANCAIESGSSAAAQHTS